ncbi:hypothetical protein [Mariniluteicoccus flavus]
MPAGQRPVARPRNRRSAAYAALAIGALVVVGGVGVRVLGEENDGAATGGAAGAREMRNLAVGDCLRIVPRPEKGRGASGGMNIAHEEVACDRPGAVTYVVASVAQGPLACPNANYQEYWEVDDRDKKNPRRWTACLVPNLTVGTCYHADDHTRGYEAGECGANMLFKVESVAPVDDVTKCGGATEPFTFPTPARTYCVTSV